MYSRLGSGKFADWRLMASACLKRGNLLTTAATAHDVPELNRGRWRMYACGNKIREAVFTYPSGKSCPNYTNPRFQHQCRYKIHKSDRAIRFPDTTGPSVTLTCTLTVRQSSQQSQPIEDHALRLTE